MIESFSLCLISPMKTVLSLLMNADPIYFISKLNEMQGCPNSKDLGIHDGDGLCEGLNMDNVQLNFESGNEIFDCSQGGTSYQLEDGGLDCLLMEKSISVTQSNGLIQNAMEVVLQFSFFYYSYKV